MSEVATAATAVAAAAAAAARGLNLSCGDIAHTKQPTKQRREIIGKRCNN